MNLTISKENDRFVVNEPINPGSPAVGRGRTLKGAIGDYFHLHQARLGIEFTVDESAQGAETRRRRRELARR